MSVPECRKELGLCSCDECGGVNWSPFDDDRYVEVDDDRQED